MPNSHLYSQFGTEEITFVILSLLTRDVWSDTVGGKEGDKKFGENGEKVGKRGFSRSAC
jgi:hypothetical protein